MFRFSDKKRNKTKIICWKKQRNAWDFNADNIVISKLVERKANSKYLIGYLNNFIRLIVFLLLMMDEWIC